MAQQIVLLPAASPAQAMGTGYHPVLMNPVNLILPSAATGAVLVNGAPVATHISPTHQQQHHSQQVLVQQQPTQYIAQALAPSQQQQHVPNNGNSTATLVDYCPQVQTFAQLLPTDGQHQFVSILNASNVLVATNNVSDPPNGSFIVSGGVGNNADQQLIATAAVVPQQQQPQQFISLSWHADGETINLVPEQQAATPTWASPNGQQQQQQQQFVNINDFLASTIATVDDGSDKLNDQLQAKQWLKDSTIANRALRALKTAPDSIPSTASPANVSLASMVITEQPRNNFPLSSQRLLRRNPGNNETWRMVA